MRLRRLIRLALVAPLFVLCQFGGGGSPPPLLPPEPVKDYEGERLAKEEMEKAKALSRKKKGRMGTILTGGMGLTEPATTAKKSLLGA